MLKRLKGERGFTATEFLIAVAIVGILAAAIVPGVVGSPPTSGAQRERNVVQTAVDAKMAAENRTTVPAITTATNDMTAAGFGLAPAYMRSIATKGTYTVDATGRVTQVSTGSR